MTKLHAFVGALIFVLILPLTGVAEMYRWVDKNGTTHFSESPPQDNGQPVEVESLPTYENDSQEILNQDSRASKIAPSPKTSPAISGKTNSRKTPKVELYTTSWCRYCKMAREFFRRRGIPFTEYDIEKDQNAARKMKRLVSSSGVPLAVINGRLVYGFSKTSYEQALQ